MKTAAKSKSCWHGRRGAALVWVVSAVLLLCAIGAGLMYVQHRAMKKREASALTERGPVATLDLGKGVKLELVRIEPGAFMMGSPDNEPDHDISEGPVHQVTIAKPFYMGKFEVTQAQWKVIRGNMSKAADGDEYPADGISWGDATNWCTEMSKNLHVAIRLPTEAEWEYACRAGTKSAFAFGPTLSPSQASITVGEGPKKATKTDPVGSFKPNAWGLYDMHGNVWEWCIDSLQPDYDQAPSNGSAWVVMENQFNRVRRGGSWKEPAGNCRSAVRYGSSGSEKEPDMRNDQVGFRVVVDVPTGK